MKFNTNYRSKILKELPKEYIKSNLLILIFIRVLLVVIGISSLYVYRMFIDDVILGNSSNTLYLIILLTLGLWISETVLKYIYEKLFLVYVKLKTYKIRDVLVNKFEVINMQKKSNKAIGDFYETIVNDTNNIEEFLIKQVIDYSISLIYSVVIGCILLSINYKLAIISLAAVPLSFYLTYKFGSNLQKKSIEFRNLYGKYNNWLYSILKESEGIKSLGWSNYSFMKFTVHWKKLTKLFFKRQLDWCMNRTFISIKDFFFTKLLIYIIGGLLIFNDELTLGSLLIFLKFFDDFFTNVNLLSEAEMTLKQSGVGIERVYDLIESEEENWGDLKLSKVESMEVRNLHFMYDNTIILSDISISFLPGKVNAIIGESGSGKSTISKLLAKIIDASKGDIFINGEKISKYCKYDFYKKVGYLSQSTHIFNTSLRENLSCGNYAISDDKMLNTLNRVGLTEYFNALDDGLDTIIENKDRLSGGQRQLLSIAKLLLRDTDVLILDESTSALDVINEKSIVNLLKEISKDKIVIIVAHRMETIFGAHNAVVLELGKIVGLGNHKELINSNSYYSKLVQTYNEIS